MSQERFERYTTTFFGELHRGIDFDTTARGYGEYYYDCLPADRQAPILDVGCGTGHFLRFLEIQGYRGAEGVDLAQQQVEQARRHVHCPVHHGDPANFLQTRQGYYAVITLNDVLEHLPTHQTIDFLKMLRQGLQHGGALIVNVPCAAGLSSLYVRYNDFTHQVLFTEMSLRQVLLLAGYQTVRFVPENWPLKFTLRHLCYRLVRWLWHRLLQLIYFIEMPGGKMPSHWQTRLVAVASA